MKAIAKTAYLFLVFTVGSIGFALGTYNLETSFCGVSSRTEAQQFVILVAVGLVMEIAVYKLAYRQWGNVFMNYVVAHFAAFFAFIAVVAVSAFDASLDAIGIAAMVIWLPLTYLCQKKLLDIQEMQETIKSQKKEIEMFEEKRRKLTKQMTSLQGRVENKRRWTDQHQKPNQ